MTDFTRISNENLLEEYLVLLDSYYNGWGNLAREAGKKIPIIKEEVLSRMNRGFKDDC